MVLTCHHVDARWYHSYQLQSSLQPLFLHMKSILVDIQINKQRDMTNRYMSLISRLSLTDKSPKQCVNNAIQKGPVFCRRQNFETSRGICPFPRDFYVFTEFCGIRYWMVIRGQMRHILMEFGPPYCMYTWFHHEIHFCHSGFDRRNIENIELSLSEILLVNLVNRL